jgi:hypothetical protein
MNVPLKALASYQSSTIVSPETMTLPRQALLVSCFTSDNDSGKNGVISDAKLNGI